MAKLALISSSPAQCGSPTLWAATALRQEAVVANPHARQQYSGTPDSIPTRLSAETAICGVSATMIRMPAERLLVNFLYAHPVGHAVEAFAYV